MAEESMGQDEGAEKSKLFKMVKDRGLSAQAKLLEWCATMDLIAIVTVENALYVYRWEFWVNIIKIYCFNYGIIYTHIRRESGQRKLHLQSPRWCGSQMVTFCMSVVLNILSIYFREDSLHRRSRW